MTRLQREMQRMADDGSRIEELEAEIARLRVALTPFAEFAAKYAPNAESFEAPDDYVVAVIHGASGAKTINLGHLRIALKALEGT